MNRCRRFASGRWRAATRICSSTPRSRRSAPAGGWCTSAWSSPTGCTRPAGGRSSAWTSARPRPRRSGASSSGAWSPAAWSGCSWRSPMPTRGFKAALAQVLGAPWQRCTVHFLRDCLGHARKDQHGVLAALIRPIFNASSRAEARDRLSAAVAQLEGRVGKVAVAARGGRGGDPGLLCVPGRPLAQAALDQPAGALQPRDRPAHRRRRHLPRRPLADPPGHHARDRAERRVAGRPALPIGRLDGAAPRGAAPSTRHRQGGPPSSKRPEQPHNITDDVSANLLHHVPGLDFSWSPRPQVPAQASRGFLRPMGRRTAWSRRGSVKAQQAASERNPLGRKSAFSAGIRKSTSRAQQGIWPPVRGAADCKQTRKPRRPRDRASRDCASCPG